MELIPAKTRYKADNYTQKYLETQLKIGDAENYYYTVELLDSEGNFLTYLDAGTNGANVDLKFLLGQDRGTYDEYRPLQTYDAVQKTGNNYQLAGSGEALYLEHGKTYTIMAHVYRRNQGPATVDGSPVADHATGDMIKPDSENNGKRIKTFKVLDTPDTFDLTGVYEMKSDGNGNALPTVTFLPSFGLQSATVRHLKSAVVIIRDRNGIKTDVTNLFVKNPSGSLTDTDNLGGDVEYILRQGTVNGEDILQPGDRYICYVYAIRDKDGSSTSGYEAPSRNYILQGRALNGNDISSLATEQIDLQDSSGTSYLLCNNISKQTVEVTQTATHAGYVSINLGGDGTFEVILRKPFNQNKIRFVSWDATVFYKYTSDGQVKSDQKTYNEYVDTPMEIVGGVEQITTDTAPELQSFINEGNFTCFSFNNHAPMENSGSAATFTCSSFNNHGIVTNGGTFTCEDEFGNHKPQDGSDEVYELNGNYAVDNTGTFTCGTLNNHEAVKNAGEFTCTEAFQNAENKKSFDNEAGGTFYNSPNTTELGIFKNLGDFVDEHRTDLDSALYALVYDTKTGEVSSYGLITGLPAENNVTVKLFDKSQSGNNGLPYQISGSGYDITWVLDLNGVQLEIVGNPLTIASGGCGLRPCAEEYRIFFKIADGSYGSSAILFLYAKNNEGKPQKSL